MEGWLGEGGVERRQKDLIVFWVKDEANPSSHMMALQDKHMTWELFMEGCPCLLSCSLSEHAEFMQMPLITWPQNDTLAMIY